MFKSTCLNLSDRFRRLDNRSLLFIRQVPTGRKSDIYRTKIFYFVSNSNLSKIIVRLLGKYLSKRPIAEPSTHRKMALRRDDFQVRYPTDAQIEASKYPSNGYLGSITAIADKHGKTSAQIILRWHWQQAIVMNPRTSDPGQMMENMSIFDFELDNQDMMILSYLNHPMSKVCPDSRLIL